MAGVEHDGEPNHVIIPNLQYPPLLAPVVELLVTDASLTVVAAVVLSRV
ncbi:MAG: hypothetical protein ACYCTE_10855 [Acidimicrobiales bacterium]